MLLKNTAVQLGAVGAGGSGTTSVMVAVSFVLDSLAELVVSRFLSPLTGFRSHAPPQDNRQERHTLEKNLRLWMNQLSLHIHVSSHLVCSVDEISAFLCGIQIAAQPPQGTNTKGQPLQ